MGMIREVKDELVNHMIPFWSSLRDERYGGYYGLMDYDLTIHEKAVKGCILNSRILWFYANAYLTLKDTALLDEARHAYEFLRDYGIDREQGGVYWSLQYDGTPEDTTKHTYNQAFAIYALASYYDASRDAEALALARELFHVIENRCMDENGYKEAFDRAFLPVENDKLSENGIIAEKTMNTLLHVFEAYTELYRVAKDAFVKKRLMWILDVFETKIYNPMLERQEVFFDAQYNSLLDLHSYGHDIETAWLLDRGLDVLGDEGYKERIGKIIDKLTVCVYRTAFNGHSLANEAENGVVDAKRVWWVQAETIVGFVNGYQRDQTQEHYLAAARAEWEFVKQYLIDKRDGSEWLWAINEDGSPIENLPIVEPWKCPYHNGRMCMEIIRRGIDVA